MSLRRELGLESGVGCVPLHVANIGANQPLWRDRCAAARLSQAPGSDGSQEPSADLKLEAVRLMATTDTETGNSVDSGRQVVWVGPCSQNQRESGLLHIPGGSMQ